MNNENLKPSGNEFDILNVGIIFLKNIPIFLTTVFICFALAGIYIFSMSKPNTGTYRTTMNVLIEDNPVYEEKKIVEKLNENLQSAYNYENWSNKNIDISLKLPQANAVQLKISDKSHTVYTILKSTKSLKAIESYLSHTSKVLSNKIIHIMKEKAERKIKILNQNQVDFERAYSDKVQALNADILNKEIGLSVAKEQLNYIQTQLSPEIQGNGEIILRILDLKRTIKEEEIRIENLKNRRGESDFFPEQQEVNRRLKALNDDLLEFIQGQLEREDSGTSDSPLAILDAEYINELLVQTSDYKLSDYDNELKKLQSEFDQLNKRQVIKVGKIVTHYADPVNAPKKTVIFTISLVMGIMLGGFITLMKEEYLLRRRKL